MKTTTLAGSIVLPLFLLTNTVALADGLRALTKISDNATYSDYYGSQGVHYTCSGLSVEYELSNRGPNHICQVYWTIDSWHTWQVTQAFFDRFVDNKERWKASVRLPNVQAGQWQYSVFCTDLTEKYKVYLSPNQTVDSYGLSIRGEMETVTPSGSSGGC